MVEIRNATVHFPKGLTIQDFVQAEDFLKCISVSFDMKGNGCFMPEYQRYEKTSNCGIIMSQSTMHSLKKLMTTEGFDPYTKYVTKETKALVKKYYEQWECCQKVLAEYMASGNYVNPGTLQRVKMDCYTTLMTLLHNIPRGLELWVTVKSSYLQLKTQVIQRAGHKQREDWRSFIEFCYSLPRFRELCGFTDEKWNIENIFPLI